MFTGGEEKRKTTTDKGREGRKTEDAEGRN
jgi:hypothetical protein